MCSRISDAMSIPVHASMFFRCALELTSQTSGPSGPLMTSTPAKSAPTDSEALTASSISPSVGAYLDMEPPRVALERKSPAFAFLLTAATASPPTTSMRMSSPPHSTYSWKTLALWSTSSLRRDPSSCTILTCCPKDPLQSLTTMGKPRIADTLSRNPASPYPTPSKVMGQGIVLMLGIPASDSLRCVRALSSHTEMHPELLNTRYPETSRFLAHTASLSQNRMKSGSSEKAGASPTGKHRSEFRMSSSVIPMRPAAADIIA